MKEADIDTSIKTHAQALESVKEWSGNISSIPLHLRTMDICTIAVEGEWENLEYVPEKLKSYELCMKAYNRNKNAYAFFPDEYKKDFVEDAVFYSIRNFSSTPDDLKTFDMCLYVAAENSYYMKEIPERFLDETLFIAAIQKSSYAFHDIDAKYKTPNLCLIAVAGDASNIQYVPENLRTPDICLLSVLKNGYNIQYVPENLRTHRINSLAVTEKGSGSNIQYVPENMRTMALCEKAVLDDGDNLKYVPMKIRENDSDMRKLCLIAAKQGKSFRHVPEKLRDLEICTFAVKTDPENASYAPKDLLPEVYKNIFTDTIYWIRRVSKSDQNQELVTAFIENVPLSEVDSMGDLVSLRFITPDNAPLLLNVKNKSIATRVRAMLGAKRT